MKTFIILLCLLISLAGQAASPLTFKGSDGATVSVCVTDLATGRDIVSHNVSALLIPASVTKCVTAATAVATLPADTRFTTSATAYGTLSDGVLHGNICITGTGDPTLGSRHLNSPDFRREVTDWLRKSGVDSVAGTVLVADPQPALEGTGLYWLVEDLAWEYGAPLYAVNYRDNSFSMTVDRRRVTRMSPMVEDLEVEIELKPGQADKIDAVRTDGGNRLLLTGTLKNPTYTSLYSLPSPSAQLQGELLDAMAGAGIGCSQTDAEGADTQAFPSLIHKSPQLDAILAKMMEKSVNLYAEAALRRAGGGMDKNVGQALTTQADYWKGRGVDLAASRIVDGSGLAPVNRISAATLSRLLGAMAREQRYTRLFPRVGMEGTVRGLLADTRLKGKLILKSGSMNGVLCYAGYKLGADNRPTHTVVVMVNGFTVPTREVRAAIARWLLSTF